MFNIMKGAEVSMYNTSNRGGGEIYQIIQVTKDSDNTVKFWDYKTVVVMNPNKDWVSITENQTNISLTDVLSRSVYEILPSNWDGSKLEVKLTNDNKAII